MRPEKIKETTQQVLNEIYRGQFEEIEELDEDLLSSVQRSFENNKSKKDTETDNNTSMYNSNEIYSKKHRTVVKNDSKVVSTDQVEFDFEVVDYEQEKIAKFNEQIKKNGSNGMTQSLNIDYRTQPKRDQPDNLHRKKKRPKKTQKTTENFSSSPEKEMIRKEEELNAFDDSKSVESIKEVKTKRIKPGKGRSFHLNKLFKRVLNNSNNVDMGKKFHRDFKKKKGDSNKALQRKLKKTGSLVTSLNAIRKTQKKNKLGSVTSIDKNLERESSQPRIKKHKSIDKKIFRLKNKKINDRN